jgi:hypothetical protein
MLKFTLKILLKFDLKMGDKFIAKSWHKIDLYFTTHGSTF